MNRHAFVLAALLLAGCSSDKPAPQAEHTPPAQPMQPAQHTPQAQPEKGSAAMPATTPAQPRAEKSSAPAKVFPYEVHKHSLDNGLKVLFIPMPSHGLSAYWSIVRTGSRDEIEPGVTGFAHFFEHMMFHGTKDLPGKEYDKIVNGMGADANAFTTDDFTAYHLGLATADVPTAIRIEAERFQHLDYEEEEFKTEAGAVYGEYAKDITNKFEVLFEKLQDAAFDKHTYKHTTIGFEADIKAMPKQYTYSKGFFQRFYRPENVVLVIAGDGDEKALLADIQKAYGGWTPGYQAPAVPAEPVQKAQRRIDVPFDGQTLPVLCIAFKGERMLPTDRRMVAGSLIGELLFGETSELYKKLVLNEQRVESMFQGFDEPHRDPNLWSVFALVKDPADVASVEGEIWSAIADLRQHGPTQAQLDAIRSRTKYGFLSGLTTPTSVCESLARLIAVTGDIDVVDQMYATLEQVTPADVQAAAEQWLLPEHSTVAVVHSKDQPMPTPTAAEPPILMPVPQDPNVSFKLWFKVGSQDDPPGKEGLAALTGAMISDGGTQTHPYEEILAALYPLAAGYSVSVDKEMTVVTGVTHRDNLAAFYSWFSDAVLKPGFRDDDFARLRDSALNGIEKDLRFSSDEELGKATLISRVYAGTPYAHYDDGTVSALKALTVQDVKDFWAQHFTKDNVVIALGGSYPADLPDRLVADMARLPEGATAVTATAATGTIEVKAGTPANVVVGSAKPEATPAPKPAPIQGRHVTIVTKTGDRTAISAGVPIDLQRGSREYYALWIANSWLGEHRNSSSHLYQVIREARGMNYGDYTYIEAYPNGGQRDKPPTGVGRRSQMFELWLRPVKTPVAVFALRAALREIDMLHKNGLTKEQFDFTRGFLRNYTLHFAETTTDRLGYAVDDRYFGVKDPGDLAMLRQMMDSITLEECNAAIKKYIQADNLQIAIVTSDGEAMAKQLASGAPTPMDYEGVKKDPALLDEDKQIENFPLNITRDRIEIVPVEQMFE
jgi:zinc protease